MILILCLLQLFHPVDEWVLSCSQYQALVDRLYEDPYFSKTENLGRRRELHDIFRSRTLLECLEVEV